MTIRWLHQIISGKEVGDDGYTHALVSHGTRGSGGRKVQPQWKLRFIFSSPMKSAKRWCAKRASNTCSAMAYFHAGSRALFRCDRREAADQAHVRIRSQRSSV